MITFPEPEDSAEVRTDVQTAPALRLSVVLCSRLMYIHLRVHTHAYTYIHRPVHTHTPWPRCGPEDDRLSSKLLGFVWEFMVGQRQGWEETPGMTGTCPPCSSHLPRKRVPTCPPPPFPTCPKIPHTPPRLPHTPTMPWFPPFLGPQLTWSGLTSSRTADHLPLLSTSVRISSGPVTVSRKHRLQAALPKLGAQTKGTGLTGEAVITACGSGHG